MTKSKKRLLVYIGIVLVILLISMLTRATTVSYSASPITTEETSLTLSHAQQVWKSALEWCESRGDPDAVNKEDLDGTPSYGAWQFKPSTLDYFSVKYDVATSTSVMDRDWQDRVITQMILHRDEIKWSQQFPWCVKKLGNPPK